MPPRKPTPRRARNSGSITFDKQKQRFVARLPDASLVNPEKKLFKTRDEAVAWLDQKAKDRADRIQVVGIPTVAEWLTHWHSFICKVKVTTHEDYGDVIRVRIVPYLGSIRLDELTIDHIRQWLKRLDEEGYAFNSARNAFRLLRQALAAALLERPAKLRENPTDGIKLRTPDSIDDDVVGAALSFVQVNIFLHVVADHRLYGLYVVAITTGLRQAELIGLRWPRVEIDKAPYHILVREQIRPVHGKRTRLSPKSKRSKRDVPIDDDLAAVLREHRTLWREEKLRLAREYPTWQTTDLVFPSLVGTSIGHENLRRHFKATLVKAQLDPIRFHDLRHTAGSLMLVQGINIVAVSEILGHSSVAVTAEIYAHSFADQKREAVAAVTNGLRLNAGGVR